MGALGRRGDGGSRPWAGARRLADRDYSWRYVFYINLTDRHARPSLGMSTFLPEPHEMRARNWKWLGFGTLSLAIGAMQIALDRGEEKDWFGSGRSSSRR